MSENSGCWTLERIPSLLGKSSRDSYFHSSLKSFWQQFTTAVKYLHNSFFFFSKQAVIQGKLNFSSYVMIFVLPHYEKLYISLIIFFLLKWFGKLNYLTSYWTLIWKGGSMTAWEKELANGHVYKETFCCQRLEQWSKQNFC